MHILSSIYTVTISLAQRVHILFTILNHMQGYLKVLVCLLSSILINDYILLKALINRLSHLKDMLLQYICERYKNFYTQKYYEI